MGKNRELTVAQRSQIIGLFKGKHTRKEISEILGFPIATVKRTIQVYGKSETPVSKQRSGRPKVLGDNVKNVLREIVTNNNRVAASDIKKSLNESTGLNVSVTTIYRNLHEIGLNSRSAALKPLLSETQRQKRLEWCINRRSWTLRQWRSIIWSDESRFTLFGNDAPTRIWREKGTRFNIENLAPTVKHGGGGIMVWGCFTGKGLGPLVRVEGKMNHQDYINILENALLPFIQENFSTNHYKFQDDNAPVHTAKNVIKYLSKKKVRVLEDWPSQSPDLNPIEHLWDELSRRLKKRPTHPKNKDELENCLREEWQQIPHEKYLRLIDSMPRRIEECISNNGWATSY